ncbi:MAG TPA: phenylalanine--tRNA ligase subunit beta, partial [Gammaproteobacteria bacterium]
MKFSENWLRELIDLPVPTEKLLEQLNLLGLEVDAVEPVAPMFSDVVVAEIVSVAAHPEADRLRVCQVNAGRGSPLQIVCGAPNAAAGLKVPLALAGARLPNDMIIRKSKLRGVESFGMLCSEAELGLLEKADGLMALPPDAPVGQDMRQYLQLDDIAVEIDLTPNRGDCLSLRGVARELAVANGKAYIPASIAPVVATIKDTFPVRIEAADACPRYAGRVIRGINAEATTPPWMVEKLRRSGLRTISPAVDITNYVMLELGQPMHAFDLKRLKNGIRVRRAQKGERLHLLDGSNIDVQPGTLVIADAKGPCALAGIMGGELSAVSADTRDIFLESAFFAPAAIIGWPRRYGLHTDSSHRFERGVDPSLQREALERATQLLLEIVGGKAGPVIDCQSEEHFPVKAAVALRRNRIEQLLGSRFDDKTVETILKGLGVGVEPVADGWRLTPPSHRFDLNIEV